MATERGDSATATPADSDATPITVAHRGQAVTFRYSGHLTPAGNPRLTDAEYRTACRLADRIGELKAKAGAIGQDLRLDPAISTGANAWASDTADAWHPLFAKGRRDIEHLRLYCQPFTGFDPITNALNGVAPTTIPANIDELLSRHTNISIALVELLVAQRQLPDHARVRLPSAFGETGPICDGILANYDAWSLQTQMNGLHGSGVLGRLRDRAEREGRVTVADIGSGFGGLGYQLGRAVQPANLRLIAVDLPDSLLLAAVYLSLLWEGRPTFLAMPEGYLSIPTWRMTDRLPESFAAVFVVNYLADRVLRDLAPIDLIANFRSMQEMSDDQVAHYGRLAQATLGDDGLLYEQNERSRSFDRDVKGILGAILPFGGAIPETDPPHRAMGTASVWSNRPFDLIRPDGAA